MLRTSGLRFELVTYVGVVLLLAAACPRTQGQNGFLSIDCGYTDSPFYFDNLGLSWESDTDVVGGIPMSSTFLLSLDDPFYNPKALTTYRYFPEPRNKYCYDLEMSIVNTSILVRTMFFLDNSSTLELPIAFDLAINGTVVDNLQFDSSDIYFVTFSEVIVFSPASMMHLCLLPIKGTPFISSIELRALRSEDTSLYNYTNSEEQFLRTVIRLNCGSNDSVRYPDDRFDRLWQPQTYISGAIQSTTAGAVSFQSPASANNVPPRVMADAWEYNELGTEIWVTVPFAKADSEDSLYAVVYFEELNSTNPLRLVNTTINGRSSVTNVTEYSPSPVLKRYYDLPNPSNLLNFNFSAAAGSTAGPIVNALEAFIQSPFNFSRTAESDVDALASLQKSVNLTGWQGDPCLPVPWNWVACDTNYTSMSRRVTKILLSNSNLNGTIPPALSQMDALTVIRLDNNSLSGTVPPALANIRSLSVLALNDNKLTGKVPPILKDKTGLNFTYQNNDFSDSKSWTKAIIGATVGGVLFLLLLVAAILICYFKSKPRRGYRAPGADVTLKAVLAATDNNSKQIGVGSYGNVYHGYLDGKEVAVKVNGIHSDQRNQEFITEVDILTRVHHKNLVSLLGYCSEGQKLILIYEFQSNGTLREWLYSGDGKTPLRGFLDWSQRLRIAVDAAKGLEYLHKNCVPPIIHRDVKTSNILLDEYLVGKVADFGVSKTTLRKLKSTESITESYTAVEDDPDSFDHDTGGFFTNVKGTPGYLDPEYIQTMILSPKCDVYSFGVVLAELISGRPAIRRSEDGNTVHLLSELHKCVESGKLEDLADPSLEDKFDWESMLRVANIALACVRTIGDERPDISEVVRSLEMSDANIRDGLQDTITYSASGSEHGYSSYPNTGSSVSTSTFPNSTSSSAPQPGHSVHWGSATTYY